MDKLNEREKDALTKRAEDMKRGVLNRAKQMTTSEIEADLKGVQRKLEKEMERLIATKEGRVQLASLQGKIDGLEEALLERHLTVKVGA